MANLFHNIYELSLYKSSTLKTIKFRWSSYNPTDLIIWKRPLNNSEIREFSNINIILQSTHLTECKDLLSWGPQKSIFSSSFCYRSLINSTDLVGPWNSIWKQKVPPKIELFLWQLAHQCLPTSVFLYKWGISRDILCKSCKRDIEDMNHIFWTCPLAIQACKLLTDWLEYHPARPNSFNLVWLFNSFNTPTLRGGGLICLSATLWSIWLARNELVFNNVQTTPSSLEYLIKYRSFCWGLANRSLTPSQLNVWEISPLSLLKFNHRIMQKNIINYWFQIVDLVGLVDGAWNSTAGSIKASIGGILLLSPQSVTFLFTGPSSKSSPYECELDAFLYLLDQISNSPWHKAHITVFTDSKTLVNNVSKECINLKTLRTLNRGTAMMENINVIYIDRALKSVADNLAKKGTSRQIVISGWF